MNSSMIRYILGHIIKLEGLFLLLPCLIAIIYQEKQGVIYMGVAAICILFGMALSAKKPENTVFYLSTSIV